MEKHYIINTGFQLRGPYDLEQMKTKSIQHQTQIWYQGLADWTPAEKIEELKPILTIQSNPASPSIEVKQPEKQAMILIVAGIFLLALVLTVMMIWV